MAISAKRLKYLDIIATFIGGLVTIILGAILLQNNDSLLAQNLIKDIKVSITFGVVLLTCGSFIVATIFLFLFIFRYSTKRHWVFVLLLTINACVNVFGSFYLAVPKDNQMYFNGETIVGGTPLQFIIGISISLFLFLVVLIWKVFFIGFQTISKGSSRESLRKLFHLDIKQAELKKVLPDRLAAKTEVINEGAYAKNEFRIVTRPYSHPLYKRISPEREALLGRKRQKHEQKMLSRQEKTREIQRKRQYKLFERAQNNFKIKKGGK